MSNVVYDASVLIAADRNDRRVWVAHKALMEGGVVPRVPAAVVAQASRSSRHAQLRRFLRGCIVAVLDEESAHAVGRLLAAARTADVVDASVVTLAIEYRASIVTGDPGDIERLVHASRVRLSIIAL